MLLDFLSMGISGCDNTSKEEAKTDTKSIMPFEGNWNLPAWS